MVDIARASSVFVRRIFKWVAKAFRWSSANSAALTGLATVALAGITLAYLVEVRQQRKFAYAQLAMQNEPDIELFGPTRWSAGAEVLQTGAGLKNHGGPVEELKATIVFVCCVSLEKDGVIPEDLVAIRSGWHRNRLGRGREAGRLIGITGADRERFSLAVEGPQGQAYSWVLAEYTRPAYPFQESECRADSTGFRWNPLFNKWMNVPPAVLPALERVVFQRFPGLEEQDCEPSGGSAIRN